jgi:ABC-type phosphate transport system substrate-binding protein
MRVALKIAAVASAAATALALAVPAAQADPKATPALTNLTAVGSDTITPLFDEGGINVNDPGGCTATAPDAGTLAADFDTNEAPAHPVESWDAVNPCTGTADETITTKAKNSSDTSCQLERPDGSSAGIAALNENQTDTNESGGETVYCIDFARSSRAPNTTSTDDAFYPIAQDAITWSSPKVSGETNPEPASLTLTQLQDIYTCVDTTWNEVGGSSDAPIGAVLPQSGSGTRSSFLGDLGITATSEPCWQNGTVTVDGVSDVIEENTGLSPGNVAQFTTTQDFGTTCADGCAPADDIFPYSIGDNIAQGTKTDGVGGHANAIWGHGNLVLKKINGDTAITKNSSGQPVINPSWDVTFDRLLYLVTRNGCFVSGDFSDVCLPSTTGGFPGPAPSYEVNGIEKFFKWVCSNSTAKADIVSYGFTKLSSKTLATCGELTAGD